MTQKQMNTQICIPTLNAAGVWNDLASSVKQQDCRIDAVLIIDSESDDETARLAQVAGFRVRSIHRCEFDHGRTRQMATKMLTDADILVFLTQDVILTGPQVISNLTAAFNDPRVAIAYGRQLPRRRAGSIEAHARLFNYPATSEVREFHDKERLGFKTIFVSNSFAAYRRAALIEVGGFPDSTIFGEDTITAARLLIAGYKIAYVADATVYHSHAQSWTQEFKRYFDIGVLHSREHWLLQSFGGAGGAGVRFLVSELKYLWHEDKRKVPDAVVRTALKYAGYRLGRMERALSRRVKRRLSMNGRYWLKPQ